jgi:hypothetical protein
MDLDRDSKEFSKEIISGDPKQLSEDKISLLCQNKSVDEGVKEMCEVTGESESGPHKIKVAIAQGKIILNEAGNLVVAPRGGGGKKAKRSTKRRRSMSKKRKAGSKTRSSRK